MLNKLVVFLAILAIANLFAQNVDKGKISGEAFIDYFYNISRDSLHSALANTGLKGVRDLNGFEFRRITFTYDYEFSDKFQTRVRFEGNQASTTGSTTNVFIKDLSLKWKNIFDGNDLIFGIQPPPSFEVSESYWQFRSLEKTIMDLRNVAASRDMGIALKGKLDNDALFNYWIMFANNSNLGAETDKYKRAYAHLNLAPAKNINITIYGDYKFRSKFSVQNSNNQTITFNNDVITTAVFMGIKDVDYSFGAEGFYQVTKNGYKLTSATGSSYNNLNGFGLSLFGNYQIFEKINLLGRFDYFDPNSKTDYDSRNFVVLGLSFLAEKNIRVIPNILLETYEKSSTYSFDPSLTGRITIYFAY
ncbi:MAG: hypothetical protein HXY50_04770 [Ignavibacteriaceae bacterium]|nr:hypothetical protein [Ignavibacteriaceae bacterium]